MTVREALLDDIPAISALIRQGVGAWQRINTQGQVENVPYSALSVYERWTHGGAWMSAETGAVHLARLLRGIGVALVMVQDGEIVGYAEAYPGDEPAPFGKHLHIARIAYVPDYFTAADGLLRGLLKTARFAGWKYLTVSLAGENDEMTPFYAGYGFQPVASVQRYTLTARTGQVFYKVNALDHTSASQIQGWHMPAGRTESAAYHWESLMPRHWEVIPQIASAPVYRLSLSVSGQDACIHAEQHPYDPRRLALSCWSPRPLTPQILSALRDWAYRQNYRTLALTVDPAAAEKLFASEGEREPFRQDIYAWDTTPQDD